MAALLLLPPRVAAETAELPLLSMQDAVDFNAASASDLGWSAPGRLIAIWQEPGEEAEIVEWNLATGTRRVIEKAERAIFSPDGRWILLLRGERWWLKNVRTGKAEPIASSAEQGFVALSPPMWARDSRSFAFLESADPPRASKTTSVSEADGVRFVDVGAEADRRFGSGGTEQAMMKSRVRIGRVDAPAALRAFDIAEDAAYRGGWGKGGDFYFMPLEGHWYGHRSRTMVRALDPVSGRSTDLYTQPGLMQLGALRVSPDGRSIAFTADVDNRRWDDFDSLSLLDIRTRKVRRLTTSLYVSDFDWAPSGDALFLTARDGAFSQIYRVDLHSRVRQISKGDERRYDLSVSPDGKWLAYLAEDALGHRDLRVLAVASGSEMTLATLVEPARAFRLASARQVRWKTPDGPMLHGLLFLPPGFDPKRKYPMFVDVHGGGPAARLYLSGVLADRARLPLEWHAWADKGYIVFVPNYRSSGEYGPQIAAERYAARDWDTQGIRQDAADIESGVRWLIGQGNVNPCRIAILGHSAGGARVQYLLTRTSLFTAAILHDPIPPGALAQNLAMMTGDYAGAPVSIGTTGELLGENPEAYFGGYLIDGVRIRTPTLIMVGNPDKGAIDPQSSEFLFSLLRANGVPARMVRFVDDGHNPGSSAASMRRYREMDGWLDQYLPDRPAPSE
ncbi:S9 family peptidase [Flavisphingomonas formosensis]|uniref:S9 family peptidase n=1 Tax=Flavisphingomonas formosensis TaxID=861534 RepID=UPI0012FB1ECE|nr:prolyl oligopeptidase family serine peptidase [Sphingomonas formosensis]